MLKSERKKQILVEYLLCAYSFDILGSNLHTNLKARLLIIR